MGLRGLGAILALVASPAGAAQISCLFDTECFENEVCAESEFYLEVPDGERPLLGTIFGNMDVLYQTDSSVLAEGEGMQMLLSLNEEGVARASVHLPGPMVTTYLGQCEVVE
ncbi:MAG: hypothetical protein AAF919_04550 [Pseudomonadota bacterium]